MKKTLLIVTIVSLFATTTCFAAKPSVAQRISAVVKHSFLGGLSGAGTYAAVYAAMVFSKMQSGQVNLSEADVIETLGRPLGELSNKALHNPHATFACLGLAAGLGALCLYNTYKVGTNFFGIFEDNL